MAISFAKPRINISFNRIHFEIRNHNFRFILQTTHMPLISRADTYFYGRARNIGSLCNPFIKFEYVKEQLNEK